MITSVQDITDDQKKIIDLVKGRFAEAKKLHDTFRPGWETQYSLYRSYRQAAKAYQSATTEAGRDEIVRQAQKDTGIELFIPMAFSIVETVTPRILSNDPRMLALPLQKAAEKSTEPVKRLFERDQAAINYEMKLQGPVRSGLIYGLGVQKNYWEERYRDGTTRTHVMKEKFFTRKGKKLIHRGPQADPVDIWDFFWDPAAYDMDSAEWCLHRTWRSEQYIKDRIAQGDWEEMSAEFVHGLGSDKGRAETWNPRLRATGMSGYDANSGKLHEVLEYHDRDNVYTLLDGQVLVQEAKNPFHHGDLPFSIFRPTIVPNEFVGIGEVEPIQHLQFELNDLRTKRRIAGDLAIDPGHFYSRGMIDPADMQGGSGAWIPVLGDPSDVVKSIPVNEPPASSWQEEAALKGDIDRTSGISDEVAGSGQTSPSATATGTQLIQAAAGERIKQKAKNLNKELVRNAAAQWLELYRQHVKKSQDVRVDTPDGWNWVKVKPRDLSAKLEVVPEAGATEPTNPVQKRQDATDTLAGLAPFDDMLDKQELLKWYLDQVGVPNPEQLILKEKDVPEEPPPAPAPAGPDAAQLLQIMGEYMIQAGMPEPLAGDVAEAAWSAVTTGEIAPPEEPLPEDRQLEPA